MSYTDHAAQARSYSATASAATRRATADAQCAAQQYALAGEARRTARWLTQHPGLWRPEYSHTPAEHERRERGHVRLAGVFLRSSFRGSTSAQFYRGLAARYRDMEAKRAARLAQYAAECAACGTADGPDRRARWEAGVTDRETWERCERCGAPLCDGCALVGTRHDRPGTDRECAPAGPAASALDARDELADAAQLARIESSACDR